MSTYLCRDHINVAFFVVIKTPLFDVMLCGNVRIFVELILCLTNTIPDEKLVYFSSPNIIEGFPKCLETYCLT